MTEARLHLVDALNNLRKQNDGYTNWRFPSGYVRDLVAWIEYGIKVANRHFERMGVTAWQVSELFREIEEKYAKLRTRATDEYAYAYDDALVVEVNYETPEVRVYIDVEEDRYDEYASDDEEEEAFA